MGGRSCSLYRARRGVERETMAETKQSDKQGAKQDSKSDDVREHLAHAPDKEHHPKGEPKMSADQSSYPGGEATIDDPPVRSPRYDEYILSSLATGAGQHVPPDSDKYDEQGRVRD